MNGTITPRRPRVRGPKKRFVSCILPPFQRHTPEVAALLPELWLHGLSTGDFGLALRGLLGDDNARSDRACRTSPAAHLRRRSSGTWGAVAQCWPTSAEQRCWNHNLRNIVDAVPLTAQAEAQRQVQQIVSARSRADAEQERQAFHRAHGLCYPKACERLDRD